MEDRHGALVDVLQDSTDFDRWKGSVRIARLIGDHPRPRFELLAHQSVGLPKRVENNLDGR
ncbi:MAG TPA: hypothetical protein VF962_10315, partial [Gemmatimonadaceae bacterium]